MGIIFIMDSSEFTPPVRQSLTDEQISAQLGSATADEAGMLAAMDFLEEQTRLRDIDNRATAQWLASMENSPDPRAKLALVNFERAKAGQPALTELEIVQTPEPVIDPEVVIEEEPQPELEVIPEAAEEPIGSAEEAAEVLEESLEPEHEVVNGYRLLSAANWILAVGVLVPAVGAAFAALNGLDFVTSILAGLVGVLVGIKVNIFGLITARRTNRGLAVASRSAFGVFGAILPGLLLLLAGLAAIGVISFGAGKHFDNTIVGLPAFDSTVIAFTETARLTFGGLFALILVTVASTLAIFGGKFARIVKVSLAAIVLAGFLVFAILTTPSIDYLNLAGVFEAEKFLPVASIFALSVSVLTYGVDAESLSIASWGASKKRLGWPMLGFGFLLPFLVYGHQAALLNGHEFQDVPEIIDFLLKSGSVTSATILVDVALVAVLGLLYWAISKLIEATRTLGTNHIGYGSAIVSALSIVLVVILVEIFSADSLALSLTTVAILLVPAAVWIGIVLTETVMRRGAFHDASLTRSYGFYGAVNWVSVAGYLLITSCVLGLSAPIEGLGFVGFLTLGAGFQISNLAYSGLLAMGVAVVFTLVTGYPSILRQQRETKAVEDRKFDLLDVVVE